MRCTTSLVRPVCALALLALLAGAIGVRDDTARGVPVAGTTIEALGNFAPAEAAGNEKRHVRADRHRDHRPRHKSRGHEVGAARHGRAGLSGNSAATITGSFTDSCRDFSARSSKDISHVEIQYVDGRVVKDESTTTAVYAIDGGPGDEIDVVKVKSGKTTESFICAGTNGPPTALLEILTPASEAECFTFFESGLFCDQLAARSVWRSSSDFPTEEGSSGSEEAGNLLWGCNRTDGDCSDLTFEFRGTGSSDSDNDLDNWEITFDDGTSASGDWSTNPPANVQHTFDRDQCGATVPLHCVVTLTVTDAAGQSDTDTITMAFIDTTPD